MNTRPRQAEAAPTRLSTGGKRAILHLLDRSPPATHPDPVPLRIIRTAITPLELAALAPELGDMVKVVVDVERGLLAIGGEMHADEEAALLDDGSRQMHLWGINLYPAETGSDWMEFDSMTNVRPSQVNRSRDVDDPTVRDAIRRIVASLVPHV